MRFDPEECLADMGPFVPKVCIQPLAREGITKAGELQRALPALLNGSLRIQYVTKRALAQITHTFAQVQPGERLRFDAGPASRAPKLSDLDHALWPRAATEVSDD